MPSAQTPPRQGPFDRDAALDAYKRGVEIEDRLYNYVLYPGDSDVLCVHYSAFFGEWGERRRARALYQGYFHRMRMFWPLTGYRFLFLCDTFGADQNGTYYKGEDGDWFVERAMNQILDEVQEREDVPADKVVMMGSSMGATAAVRFALDRQAAGAIAVSPHFDLDLCARHQGRARHVAAILGSQDVEDPRHFPVTREIRRAGRVGAHPAAAGDPVDGGRRRRARGAGAAAGQDAGPIAAERWPWTSTRRAATPATTRRPTGSSIRYVGVLSR